MTPPAGSIWVSFQTSGRGLIETERGRGLHRCAGRLGKHVALLRLSFVRRRSDLGPSLAQANGLAQSIEELCSRCSNVSSARYHRARENAHGDARPVRAISGRPPRVHVQVAAPTWKSWVARRADIESSEARVSNDRPLTGSVSPRHTTESLDIITLLEGPNSKAGSGEGICLPVPTTPGDKKLTRPDGEIRAGRVDRRRGSGGVSADRGCNPGLFGPFIH